MSIFTKWLNYPKQGMLFRFFQIYISNSSLPFNCKFSYHKTQHALITSFKGWRHLKKQNRQVTKYEGQRLKYDLKRKISEESLIRNGKEWFTSNMATTLNLRLSSPLSK